MTLERTEYAGQSVVRVTLTACPAQNCAHTFDPHEARWKHLLDEHGPEDFGLGPRLVTDGGEEVPRATRQKTEFWGYDQHERSVRDVVDEETWQTELEWAVEESLAYARMVESPDSVIQARHCIQRNFMGHFEAMLNDLLHEPLNLSTATETVQQTEQATLGGGSVAE